MLRHKKGKQLLHSVQPSRKAPSCICLQTSKKTRISSDLTGLCSPQHHGFSTSRNNILLVVVNNIQLLVVQRQTCILDVQVSPDRRQIDSSLLDAPLVDGELHAADSPPLQRLPAPNSSQPPAQDARTRGKWPCHPPKYQLPFQKPYTASVSSAYTSASSTFFSSCSSSCTTATTLQHGEKRPGHAHSYWPTAVQRPLGCPDALACHK